MKQHSSVVLMIFLGLSVTGCVTPIDQTSTPPLEETRVYHSVKAKQKKACGDLHKFLIDIDRLNKQQQKSLLDELSAYPDAEFSCDRLKTGLLLSQIGKTTGEDNLAIEILGQYIDSDRLSHKERELIRILNMQNESRKRLHILLGDIGDRLVAEKYHSDSLRTEIETLQEKIRQLQQIESDINETEQSISTPATTSLTEPSAQDTGS